MLVGRGSGRSTPRTKESNAMHRTGRVMEEHRQSQEQEAVERTSFIMDELSNLLMVGMSVAGPSGGRGEILGIGGGGGRRGGVKVTFNGVCRG